MENIRKYSDEVGVQTAQIKKPPEGRFLFGWGDNTTSEPRYLHEVIDLFVSATDHIIKKCVPLYEKGHSVGFHEL